MGDYSQLILIIVQATMDILKNNSLKPSAEEIAATITNDINNGESMIAQWFIAKGLTPPQ